MLCTQGGVKKCNGSTDNNNATPGHPYLHNHLFLDVMTVGLTVMSRVCVCVNGKIQLKQTIVARTYTVRAGMADTCSRPLLCVSLKRGPSSAPPRRCGH